MSQSSTINQLLEKGLYHYGLGEISQALALWYEVLRRDPGNEAAREYIEIQTGRKPESGAPAPSVPGPEPKAPLKTTGQVMPSSGAFMEGQMFLQKGEWDRAAAAFAEVHRSDPSNSLSWAYVELARARLIKEVIVRLGGRQSIPRLKVQLTELIGAKEFSQEEGFVLSLISGDTSLEDVIALSPIPRFQTYQLLYRLLGEGLLESDRPQAPPRK